MTLYMRDREKIEEGRAEGRAEFIRNLIRNQYSKTDILALNVTEEEYEKAQKELLVQP